MVAHVVAAEVAGAEEGEVVDAGDVSRTQLYD